MGDLSANFDRDEFSCGCGCGKVAVRLPLIAALQELRDLVKVPIVITSGYRCTAFNRSVGGVSNSYHIAGMAADIHIKYMLVKNMYEAALKVDILRNGGLGLYVDRKFLHVDCRNGKARWAEMNGKRVKYFDFSKENDSGKISEP
ncbi:unnamed protein product [marine sediment metagenome]|uniref:Peptidase M15A C-terminal domain-containing protein n=1 Tax=marine sediment metagenome TaxID=412755 RepID=X1GB93_9ZZZZ